MTPNHYRTANDLDGGHRDALIQAVTNVVATEAALITYAQIIDGLPTCDIAWDTRGSKLTPQHPINSHIELCSGALDKAKSFREEFEPSSLVFKPELLHAFQSSLPSSRTFNLRLLELTSSAVHHVAVLLFQLKLQMHEPRTTENMSVDDVTTWERPPDEWARVVPHPTLFTQSHFIGHDKYPDGIADMVGYWAEDRILGGVLLFDHSVSWNDANPEPNAYIHCGRAKVTYRICQLLDDQQSQLLGFLGANNPTSADTQNGPLPILPSSENRTRIDQRDAIPIYKVYRDLWERVDPQQPRLRMQQYMDRCVVSELDYPELDFDEQMTRFDELERRPPS